jgi:hypothetical protein
MVGRPASLRVSKRRGQSSDLEPLPVVASNDKVQQGAAEVDPAAPWIIALLNLLEQRHTPGPNFISGLQAVHINTAWQKGCVKGGAMVPR